jgi:hypothetical protein
MKDGKTHWSQTLNYTILCFYSDVAEVDEMDMRRLVKQEGLVLLWFAI